MDNLGSGECIHDGWQDPEIAECPAIRCLGFFAQYRAFDCVILWAAAGAVERTATTCATSPPKTAPRIPVV
jgi:hypothetical protein